MAVNDHWRKGHLSPEWIRFSRNPLLQDLEGSISRG
jgi:hypothetical protein